ncbi:GntR family transcriptional regulator [Curtobacterium sp. MCJR17_020]|uniref:GntR family transcriptional regulator n=1 Tax=Curtobacterium sp. MCJR17_020 TaxID=2175619 RepID=UPI0011B76C7B|nr:GntR family transcriptional regulator [Curtobacterium sp. MCJR17_020]WIE72659.1 GntR family transcriptional regulator [Curtobacterium sp. MCJR17_020]
MTASDPHDDGWTREFSDAYRTVLGAIRDGSLDRDVEHDELALSGRFDISPAVLHGALERLADLGLVEFVADAAVRFGTLSVPAWVDNGWLFVGLVEGVMRSALPALTETDVADHTVVADALRRAAALRTPDLDPAFWASLRFWIDRTPNRVLARLATRAMERVRFGVEPSVPFTATDVEAWVATSQQAVRYRVPASAERSAHVLARLWEVHLRGSAERFGRTPEDLATTTSSSEDAPPWATWTPDDLWWDLLAMVRDGTLRREHTYRAREIAARLRQPVRAVMPLFRRLELMGLVDTRAEDPEGIRITRPDVQHWVDSLQLASTLAEMCARWAVPVLSEQGRAELHAVTAAARRQARIRDYAYTLTMVDLSRVLGAHTPNPWIAGNLRLALSRLAFVFDEAPPLRQWDIDDVFALLDQAIDLGDAVLAAEAMHAQNLLFDVHIADVVERLGPGAD